jgi:hypothetical protein
VNEAPDLAEPIEAWRVWRVVQSGERLLLASVVQETIWQPREALRATCLRRTVRAISRVRRRPAHEPPEEGCSCGVYAAGLEFVRQYLIDPLPSYWRHPRVVGRAALWGSVVECERGYRATLAYPAHIYLPTRARLPSGPSWGEIADNLMAYGVPVEALETRYSEATSAIRSYPEG